MALRMLRRWLHGLTRQVLVNVGERLEAEAYGASYDHTDYDLKHPLAAALADEPGPGWGWG